MRTPNNKARLMSFAPSSFADTMRRWGAWFGAGACVAGLSDADLAKIRVPTAVMPAASGDDYHPESAARILTLTRLMRSAQYLANAEYLTAAEAAALSGDHKDIAACVVRFSQRVEHAGG